MELWQACKVPESPKAINEHRVLLGSEQSVHLFTLSLYKLVKDILNELNSLVLKAKHFWKS